MFFAQYMSGRIGEGLLATSDLSVSPANGYYLENLTFSGTGFRPNESVQIDVGGVGTAALATATADANGSFSATAPAPGSPDGTRIFLAVGQESGRMGATNFSIAPRLVLHPSAGTVGSTAAVEGYGFGSQETVQLYWANPSTLLGTATADVHGTFNRDAALTFTVPSAAPVGVNRVIGRGEQTGAIGQGSFTVE